MGFSPRLFSIFVLLAAVALVPSASAATIRGTGSTAQLGLSVLDFISSGCVAGPQGHAVVLNYAPMLKDHVLDDKKKSVSLRFKAPAQSSLWCDPDDDATLVRAKIASFDASNVHSDASVSTSIKPFVSVTPTRTAFSVANGTLLTLELSGNRVAASSDLADLNRLFALDFLNVQIIQLRASGSSGMAVSYLGKRRDQVRIRGAFSVQLDNATVYSVAIPVLVSIADGSIDCGTNSKGLSKGCTIRYSKDVKPRFEPVQTAALEVGGPVGLLCRDGSCVPFEVKAVPDGSYAFMVGPSILALVPPSQVAAAFGLPETTVASASQAPARPRGGSAVDAAENAIAAFIRGRFG